MGGPAQGSLRELEPAGGARGECLQQPRQPNRQAWVVAWYQAACLWGATLPMQRSGA